MKIFYKLLLLLLTSIYLISAWQNPGVNTVSADSKSETEERLSKEIAQYEQEVERLKQQAGTLSNQIAQYDVQIKLAGLKIEETEEKIHLLSARIIQLEDSLVNLSNAFTSRVVQSYKISRLSQPYALILANSDISDTVVSYYYMKRIQEADRSLLTRLTSAQDIYKDQKNDQELLQNKLEGQKITLNSQKIAKARLLEETKNDEQKYQKLLADAKKQLAALSRFVTAQGGATILHNQTKCDSWGCYYNQRDSEWGSIGLGGSNYSVAEYGCLVSSVAMIATHYGKNIKPLDIALISGNFVPQTGLLYHSFSVNGFNGQISSVTKDRLDSELAAGRPVIAGLYSGPDHFIVIVKKEGDNYIMHDPFLENGSYRKLTDKYQVSNITSLRFVNFN